MTSCPGSVVHSGGQPLEAKGQLAQGINNNERKRHQRLSIRDWKAPRFSEAGLAGESLDGASVVLMTSESMCIVCMLICMFYESIIYGVLATIIISKSIKDLDGKK